jgi:hypothetical protein
VPPAERDPPALLDRKALRAHKEHRVLLAQRDLKGLPVSRDHKEIWVLPGQLVPREQQALPVLRGRPARQDPLGRLGLKGLQDQRETLGQLDQRGLQDQRGQQDPPDLPVGSPGGGSL